MSYRDNKMSGQRDGRMGQSDSPKIMALPTLSNGKDIIKGTTR